MHLNIQKNNSMINITDPHLGKLLNVYKILVRSKLDYGLTVYSSVSNRLLQTLYPVLNTYLRLALRAFLTTPTSSLHAITGIPPLQYRRKILCNNYSIYFLSELSSPTYLNITTQFFLKLPTPYLTLFLHP